MFDCLPQQPMRLHKTISPVPPADSCLEEIAKVKLPPLNSNENDRLVNGIWLSWCVLFSPALIIMMMMYCRCEAGLLFANFIALKNCLMLNV